MTLEPVFLRPMLRGYIHLASAIAAPFALAWLLLVADSATGYIGGAVFGVGLLLLFSMSAGYHIPPWPPRVKRILARFDHSMIFVAIAAFYTPFCLRLIDSAWGIALLAVVWSMAAAGVALKMTWPTAPKWISIPCYLAVGWVAVAAFGPLSAALPGRAIALVIAAGVMYSVGAIIYAVRWPNPIPRFAGYHEVFHLMVSGATVMLYMVVAVYVVSA